MQLSCLLFLPVLLSSITALPTNPHVDQSSPLSSQLNATAIALNALNEASHAELALFQSRLSNISEEVDALADFPSNSTSPAERAQVACQVAELLFQNVTTKEDPTYDSEREINWSQTCWLPAACFVKPQNGLEVAIALKLTAHIKSKFAVRSGGHNPNAGFGSVDETGLLIDLQRLQTMDLTPEGKLNVGAGARWTSIYDFLDSHGLGAVGARKNDIGVSGFLLGGGMSFFPNLYGLGADNVENFRVVLANSTIVNANATSNQDLFRALKGGASNFGVVIEFQIATHNIQNIWFSMDIYSPEDYEHIIDTTIQVQAAMEDDPKLGFFVNVNPEGILVGKFYAEWSPLPAAFRGFNTIVPIQTFAPETNGTLKDLVSALDAISMVAKREPHVVGYGVDLDLYTDIHEQYLGLLNSSNASSAALSYTIQPIGSACVEAGRERGGNSLGLELAPQTWLGILVEWTSDADDISAHNMVNSMGANVKAIAESRNTLLEYQFMNDASYVQQPIRSYGSESFKAMQAASAAYDPEEVFQKLQNSGFLLSRS
ncbi:FAD-binding domain-containing protein [Aaosphaeria arxii CBS 175.79]|uniref:FAD-binding domain-containing protein n=1 Tax=Aaosphaeria arxii CBS 175.79 TaxID=1450172 RepID=A0A6A5XGY4_9PLEO|nr:FAD-binding domain-containing protein [Aaosphaeria arxii CBS 175.79]KAF2012097.1 FAD-binding domain-containing protein [Aaosphaeria arxii CBS 175.79]